MIKSVGKFVAALNSNTRSGAMAAGFAAGILLGLIPTGNLLWTGLFVIIFMLKIHLPSMAVALGVMKLFYGTLDGVLDQTGFYLLNLDSMHITYTSMYNTPIVPYTLFNNTLVMGGFFIGVLALIPLWFIFNYLIKIYRNTLHPLVAKSKIVVLLKKAPLLTKLGVYLRELGVIMSKKKQEKVVSLPKIFRKTYTEKKFNKIILSRIHLPGDKEFVTSLFSKDDDGNYRVQEACPADQKKRLKLIGKAIKANKGIFVAWKAAFILITMSVIVLFNIFFFDTLIERSIEKTMESTFNAKVEVTGTDISILDGSVHFASMSVANAESPMTNLFELGPTAFGMDMWQALKRRVIIDEVKITGIAWNTPREASGALSVKEKNQVVVPEESAVADEQPATPEQKQSALSALDIDPSSFDYKGLIEEHTPNLPSVKKVEALKGQTSQMKAKWQGEVNSFQGDIDKASGFVDQFQKINLSELKDPNKIKTTLNDINDVKTTIAGLEDRANALKTGMTSEVNTLSASVQNVRNDISEDINYLQAYIKLPQGDNMSIVSGYIEDYLNERFGKYYVYAQKGYQTIQGLGSENSSELEPESLGRFVEFPQENYPKVLIRDIIISGQIPSGAAVAGNVQNITSDQEMLGKPIGFDFSATEMPGGVMIEGSADTRETAEAALMANINLNGFPFDLGNRLEAASIRSLTANASGSIALKLASISTGKGHLEMTLDGTKADMSSDNFVMTALRETLEENPTINISCDVNMNDGGVSISKLTNNLDDLLKKKVGAEVNKKADAFRAGLEKEVKDFIRSYTDQYGIDTGFMDGELSSVLDQVKEVEAMKKTIDDKKADVEQKLALLTGAVDKAKADAERAKREAEEKAAAAIKEAEEKAAAAKKEAEAEAERLKAEAEKKAKDLLGKVKFP